MKKGIMDQQPGMMELMFFKIKQIHELILGKEKGKIYSVKKRV
jgi:hypothetical protein